jgi:probable HAF family extracellular repeat protein
MFTSDRVLAALARPRTSAERRPRRAPVQLESLERRDLLAYTITSLGQVEIPSFSSVDQGIVAINSSVDVAATTGGSPGSSSEAFYLNTNGQTTSLPPLSGYSSSTATDVNASGQVSGYSSKNNGLGFGSTINEAVLYNSQGQATDLGNLGGNSSQATGINDSGQVVGSSTTSTAGGAPTHSFLYNGGGKLIDLGTLGGSTSYATAINDSGQIVGYSTTSTSSNSPTHAFLLKGSGPMSSADDLGLPPGYTSSYATAISPNGVFIAGYATKTVTTSSGVQENVTEPFLYANGQWIDLGNLGGNVAEATGINDSGQAVGYSTTSTNTLGGLQTDAFLYTSSQGIQDLKTLIDSGSKWTLETATAINDNGVIAGIGGGPDGKTDGFLLYPPNGQSPTPTPTTPTPTPITPTPTPITPTPPPTPITPTPPPGPGNPTPGSLRTRVQFTAHPRSAKVGQPVTLIATVKVLGHGRGIPTGSVEFLGGSAILDTIALSGGKATLRASSLPVGRDAIRVNYVGAGNFTSSTSGVVIVNIKMPRGPRVDQGSPAASRVPASLIDAE